MNFQLAHHQVGPSGNGTTNAHNLCKNVALIESSQWCLNITMQIMAYHQVEMYSATFFLLQCVFSGSEMKQLCFFFFQNVQVKYFLVSLWPNMSDPKPKHFTLMSDIWTSHSCLLEVPTYLPWWFWLPATISRFCIKYISLSFRLLFFPQFI